MERWRGLDAVPSNWGRCVLTIGVFDGMHEGHRSLVAEAVRRARDLSVPSMVMTFDPHPSEVLRPGSHPAQLLTLRRRAELADQLGVDVFLVVPFTPDFAALEAESFVHDVVVGRLHTAAIVVGTNFTFGRGAKGDVRLLTALGRRFGFAVDGVPLTERAEVTVSSTMVRSLVAAGDVRAVTAALGRPHRVEGIVVHGEGRGGSELGYPTANLDVVPYAAVPADGIYAGWFLLGDRRSPAAISVGSNPTFSGRVRTVEAFVLDEGGNFYGRRVALDFIERLRDQERYDSIEDLIAQIGRDVARTREVLAT